MDATHKSFCSRYAHVLNSREAGVRRAVTYVEVFFQAGGKVKVDAAHKSFLLQVCACLELWGEQGWDGQSHMLKFFFQAGGEVRVDAAHKPF